MNRLNVGRIARACAVAVGVWMLTVAAAPQTNGSPERFTAVAINMGTPGRAFTDRVDITVNRWSSDADRDKLMKALFEKGPEKLLDTLVDLPRVGSFRTPNSLAYDLHFARRTPLPEGGERVVLATDRYISFWEASNRPRSIDYPFTVIELRMKADGTGEGKMSLATKITGDHENGIITLENYSTQPVQLSDVRREKP